jgi:hypothetical protein
MWFVVLSIMNQIWVGNCNSSDIFSWPQWYRQGTVDCCHGEKITLWVKWILESQLEDTSRLKKQLPSSKLLFVFCWTHLIPLWNPM